MTSKTDSRYQTVINDSAFASSPSDRTYIVSISLFTIWERTRSRRVQLLATSRLEQSTYNATINKNTVYKYLVNKVRLVPVRTSVLRADPSASGLQQYWSIQAPRPTGTPSTSSPTPFSNGSRY